MNINSRIARANFTGYASGAVASFTGLREAPVKIRSYINAIQEGSGNPSPDNIRPITGWSDCNVVRCGKNLFPYDGIIEYTYTWYSGSKKLDDALYPFFLKGNTTYILHYVNSNADAKPLLRVWKSDGTILNNQENVLNAYMSDSSGNTFKWQSTPQYYMAVNASSANAVILSPTEDIWVEMRTSTQKGTSTNAQIEVGSTATAYEAYTGNTYTIQLGDTYYGGSLDVTNGVLTVTWTYLKGGFTQYASGNGYKAYRKDNLPKSKAQSTGGISNMISEFGSFSSSAMTKNIISLPISTTLYMALDENYNANDVEVCYELATPITVQLSPTQVEQLLGVNNVFAYCGNVEIYYVTI